MKKTFNIVICCFAVTFMYAIPADTPKLPDSSKLAIRSAQIDVLQIQQQMQQLQIQYNQLQQQLNEAQQRRVEAIKSAYKEAKVTEEDYSLDKDLNLVAKEKPKTDGKK